MDLLKTLLLYMSLTFTMGVQQAAPPDPAALPTPAPTAVVEQQPGLIPTPAAVTAAPAATATPAPAITPNSHYSKLKYGDRGNQVKKLQQRLIALNYMKKGSDDGAYGYNTLNAVRAFQRANGLSVDGVAGKMTQTYLFEYKNVIAAEVTPTPTAKPKTTPAPAADAKATAAAADPASPAATDEPREPSVTDGWNRTGAKVLLNGGSVILLDRKNGTTIQRSPGVYLHDNAVMLSLSELVKASGEWTLTDTEDGGCVLTLAGYTVTVKPSADGFLASVEDGKTDIAGLTIYYSAGEWIIGSEFLGATVGASVVWENAENTLVIRVTNKVLAQSAD